MTSTRGAIVAVTIVITGLTAAAKGAAVLDQADGMLGGGIDTTVIMGGGASSDLPAIGTSSDDDGGWSLKLRKPVQPLAPLR